MEIVGEFNGFGSDKAIYDYFRTHWSAWFPNLGSRTTFTRQASNLSSIKQKLWEYVRKQFRSNDLFLFDGFPIPTCNIRRVRRRNPFRQQGAFGYCAAKDKKYFGFKRHLLTNQDGAIIDFEMTAANADEQIALEVLAPENSTIIADKGLLGAPLKQRLREEKGVNLQTPLRKNMQDNRPKTFVNQIMNVRRKIETVIGQLAERFNIQKIRAKDTWHLFSKIRRKICSHTIAFSIAGSTAFDTRIMD
jgi:IS5 family transposase